ncbi:glycosyltransferase family 2 protein [Mucilaginibacter sp. Bleaf8]|uniref:glycosyltransferase family 2 protein n=1 Tax=Mucilaginibacter sp. Bleaf8 TaxID=2834430 RepID=UPI001BCD539A|nr:glycosyltransferase family 2 protein [Mucilaginibacter sp. Bleaf8]MBS7566173.1 glycosyltransferase family 2 protein [Mucilaginibacter sp. Bleaf8]
MANIKHKISVLTVTYGDRWKFLHQVIERVIGFEQVSDVIIVNNASTYSVSDKVKALGDNRLKVLDFEDNLGSAGGYKAALAYAHQHTDADFYFWLDDDNVPDENSLPVLLNAFAELEGLNELTALYCLRTDRKAHIKVAQGENPDRYYLVPDNFLGFNLFRIPYNQLQKWRDKRVAASRPHQKYAQLPYVPYGGLLLPKTVVDKIGYPDERFYLYVDDSEYSYRVTAAGGKIWLVPACEVADVDKSQGVGYKPKGLFASVLLDQWSFRTYYHVRNRIYFYNKVATKNRLVFYLNKFLLMNWLKLISIINAQQKEYKKLAVAVYDGLHGNLGKADAQKF